MPYPMLMIREEEWQFWHGKDIEMVIDLRLACLPNDLEPEDLVG